MSEITDGRVVPVQGTGAAHDHAWRLLQVDFDCGGVSEYRCDLCAATWFA